MWGDENNVESGAYSLASTCNTTSHVSCGARFGNRLSEISEPPGEASRFGVGWIIRWEWRNGLEIPLPACPWLTKIKSCWYPAHLCPLRTH